MTMFEVDDLGPFVRRGSGVRASGDVLRTYDLTVIADDVDGVARAAGGWLCDRVRAGWHVTVVVPPGLDLRALTILGVHVEDTESSADMLARRPAAVAVDAAVLRRDEQIRAEVLRLVDGTRTEVTVWGESALFGADIRFGRVRHRLSAAARAFKSGALQAIGQTTADPTIEEFLSAALWYPTDGADLVPSPPR